jgi:surface antigen
MRIKTLLLLLFISLGLIAPITRGCGLGVVGDYGRSVTTMADTLLGAAIGSRIGRSMDKDDLHIIHHAFESGRFMGWKNSKTNYYYQFYPTNVYRNPHGQVCRNYTINNINTNNNLRNSMKGTACYDNNGRWITQ